METDQIFKTKVEKSTDFKFDAKVVNVFDDMVVRSVPFYLEIQRMVSEISAAYAKPGTSLYDLGCSTGTSFLSLHPLVDPAVHFVGIDDSAEMLGKCRKNLLKGAEGRTFDLLLEDLNGPIALKNPSVVILCLTLQFVRPIHRMKLLESVYRQLNPGGCLVLVEKVLGESADLNRQFIKYYYDMKRRNGYDELEISQKREALENVLIPYRLSEDMELLHDVGFSQTETFFKWYNFAGMIGIK